MLKRLVSAVLLLVVIVSLGFSQAKNGGVARMISLGGASPSTNFVVNPFIYDDPVWTLLNPAYLMMYKDYAWMNVGGGSVAGDAPNAGLGQQFSGANFSVAKDFVVGAVLSYDPSTFSSLRGILNNYMNLVRLSGPLKRGPNSAGLPAPGPLEVFEVVGATRLAGLDLGLGVSYGWTNSDFKNSDTTPTAISEASLPGHLFALRGGVFFDMGGGSSVNGSLAFRTSGVSDKLTRVGSGAGDGQSNYSASATEFQIQAGARLKVSNKFSFVPYAGFLTVSASPKEDNILNTDSPTKIANKITTTAFIAGAGGEIRMPSFLLGGGVSLVSNSIKSEPTNANGTPGTTATSSIFGFPVFNLGMEWWMTDWLAGRAGYFRSFTSNGTKSEPPSGSGFTTEYNVFAGTSFFPFAVGSYASDGLVTLGLGMKFKGFALDGTVSEEALRRGLGLIGSSDAINTFGYITISYCFE